MVYSEANALRMAQRESYLAHLKIVRLEQKLDKILAVVKEGEKKLDYCGCGYSNCDDVVLYILKIFEGR